LKSIASSSSSFFGELSAILGFSWRMAGVGGWAFCFSPGGGLSIFLTDFSW